MEPSIERNPIGNRQVKVPSMGDLIYGVNSDCGRKWYTQLKEGFAGVVTTIDCYPILKTDSKTARLPDDWQAFKAIVEQHPKYSSILQPDSDKDSLENEQLRRKCKAGLEWAISTGKDVHFVLDDLNLDAVIRKNYKGKNSDTKSKGAIKNRSITGSELRWLYRNRKTDGVKQHVFFWSEGKPVPAPWEADTSVMEMSKLKSGQEDPCTLYPKQTWKNYKPTHLIR